MTQRNVRGAYMNFEHDRAQDWDWLAKWQPNVIRYMGQGSIDDPASFDVNRVRRIYETCPAATILLRCWDVDDNNFKAHDAMVANPKVEAKRQVEWWSEVFERAEDVGVPSDKLMAGLNNETGPEKDHALYTYTDEALDYATDLHVRLGVFVFSVGRPSLPGEAEWTIDSFARLEPLIKQNNGAIVLHQYMQPEGMYAVWTDEEGKERKDWTYLMGRDRRWPTHVPIIIGEWGIDGILYNRHPDPKYGNSGWRNFKAEWPPNRYADEYVECVRQANDNVIGICPFLSDFSDHKWQSFDLLDAYGEFLARKDLCTREVSSPTIDTHIPVVGPGPQPVPPPQPPTKPTPMFVAVVNGANLRLSPNTGDVLVAVPYGARVDVMGMADTMDDDGPWWLRVRYQGYEGWMLAALLSDTPPAPTPAPPVQPPPQGDNWTRSMAFIERWEGEYQNNPADKGNWTGCEQGKGINKGTKYGISACSYPNLDIVNLRREEARELYRRDYWAKSGADKLEWPLCLLVMDTSVLHGVGAATLWLAEVGPNPYAFAAKRLRVYTKSDNGDVFWRGWVNRVGELLEEIGK